MRIKITVDDPGLRVCYGIKKGRICTVQGIKQYKSGVHYKILAPVLYDCNYKNTIREIIIKGHECEVLTEDKKLTHE